MELHEMFQEFADRSPVLICAPHLYIAAQVVAVEADGQIKGIHVTSFAPQDRMILFDPYNRMDPVLWAYLCDKYKPGESWTPEKSMGESNNG